MLSLDHAIVLVRDLDLAAPAYRRLGFTLTARGQHPTLGTANHTIMFERTYLELLAIVTRGPGNDRWARILEHREGFGAVAYGTRDARATATTLRARGLAVPDVVDFGRPVAVAEGTVEARFSVAHLPPDATPVLPAFFCQQRTPEHVWRPEWQRHANTAFHLGGMTVVHPDPDAVAPAYERLLGRAAVHPHAGGIALDLRGTRLWIVRPDFAAGHLGFPVGATADQSLPIGLTVLVRRLAAARATLAANGVPYRPFGRRSLLVGPTWTHGVHLEFLAA